MLSHISVSNDKTVWYQPRCKYRCIYTKLTSQQYYLNTNKMTHIENVYMKCILDYQTLNWSPVCVRLLFSNLTKQIQSLPSDNLSLSRKKCMICDWYARMVWYIKRYWHLACNAVKWLLVDIVINLHDNQYFLIWYLTSIITAYLIQIVFLFRSALA